MATKRNPQPAELTSDQLRALAKLLSELQRHDFNDWFEMPFLDSMVRRHPEYEYSLKERAKIEELERFAQVHTSLVTQASRSRIWSANAFLLALAFMKNATPRTSPGFPVFMNAAQLRS